MKSNGCEPMVGKRGHNPYTEVRFLSQLLSGRDYQPTLLFRAGCLLSGVCCPVTDDMIKITDSISLYEREDWKARPWRDFTNQGWDASEVFIHHTADEASGTDSIEDQKARMRGYQNYHMDVKGWDDIGYHYVVFPPFETNAGTDISARVFSGRPRNHVPAAQEGHNNDTLAIAVVRGGDRTMYSNQRYAVEALINWIKGRGASLRTLGGHRDASSTTCPGNGIYNIDLPVLCRATNLDRYRG